MIRSFQTLLYNTGERSEPEKNYNIKIKTTFGPPLLPIKHPCKTPPLTNLRGGGGPDPRFPPLDPRMSFIEGNGISVRICTFKVYLWSYVFFFFVYHLLRNFVLIFIKVLPTEIKFDISKIITQTELCPSLSCGKY